MIKHPLIERSQVCTNNVLSFPYIFTKKQLHKWFISNGATEDEAHTLVWEAINVFDFNFTTSMFRSFSPSLVAYNIIGVQPITNPIGSIFTIRPRYT